MCSSTTRGRSEPKRCSAGPCSRAGSILKQNQRYGEVPYGVPITNTEQKHVHLPHLVGQGQKGGQLEHVLDQGAC